MSRNGVPMQEMAVEGCTLRLRVEGEDTKPVLVLSHMLGTDLTLWDDLMPSLAANFRVVRYDTRGHGGSSLGGAISIERLGRDVLAILDGLGVESAHFCGLSMGGAIGLWLLANAPARLERVVIAGSGPKLGTPETWNARIAAALSAGMEQTVAPTIERWFGPAFVERAPNEVEAVRALIRATPPEGYAACCAALRDMDLREAVRGLATPLLIVRGADDPSVKAEDVAELVEVMPGSTALELDARHCCPIEAEGAFAAAVVKFLTARTAPRRAAGRHPAGKAVAGRPEPTPRRSGGRGLVAARRPVTKTTPVSGKAVAKANATRKTAARTAPRTTASASSHRRGVAKAAPPAAKTARSVQTRTAPPAKAPQRKADASAKTRTKAAPARRARPYSVTAASLRAAATKTGSAAKTTSKTTTPKTTTPKTATAKPAPIRAKPKSADRTSAKAAAAKPSTAKPSTAKPSTAKPSTAKAGNAKPSSNKPHRIKPSAAKPSTGRRATPAAQPRRPTGRVSGRGRP